MDLQHVVHSLMQPGDGNEIHARAHALERGSEPLFDLENRRGRAVGRVSGSVPAETKYRPDDPDGFNDERGASRRHLFSVREIADLNPQTSPSGSRIAALRTPQGRSTGP